MSRTFNFIFIAIYLFSSFIYSKNLSNKSSIKSYTSPPEEETKELFNTSCVQVSLNQYKLTISCDDDSEELDLNELLENVNGRLKFKEYGNYSQTCSKCELLTEELFEMKTYEIQCICLNRMKNEKKTSINIDEIVNDYIDFN